jgi:hypothetical protein
MSAGVEQRYIQSLNHYRNWKNLFFLSHLKNYLIK